MAGESFEFSGRSVEEAIEEGLNTLGLSRDEVSVDILNRGSRGILGFGAEEASVRLTRIDSTSATADADVATPSSTPSSTDAPAPVSPAVQSQEPAAEEPDSGSPASEEPTSEAEKSASEEELGPVADDDLVEIASEMLTKLINLMGFQGVVHAEWKTSDGDEDGSYLFLDIRGDELGALIGRRGETLASIQYLLRLMINQRLRQWKNIVVDVEQYKERRVIQLTQLAERMAEQVVSSGRAVSLEPMPANERRIVHMALRDHADVYTESSGEEERRKINIVPRPAITE